MIIKWMLVPSLFIVISLSLVLAIESEGDGVKNDNEIKPTIVNDNSTISSLNTTSSSVNISTTTVLATVATTKSTGKRKSIKLMN